MTPAGTIGAARRLGGALALVLAIAGCAGGSRDALLAQEDATPFASTPPEAAWSRQPTALLAIGRGLGAQAEQILALENATTLPGDNFLRMRAHFVDGPRPPHFALDELMRLNGGWPAPFDVADAGALRPGQDSAGDFVFAERRVAGATCVLALRRLTADANLTPPDVQAMDVILRNCVAGDRAEALAPMRPDRVAAAGGFAPPGLDEAGRTLSPLAGPGHGAVRPKTGRSTALLSGGRS